MDMNLSNSRRLWRTGRPGMLQSVGSWRVRHDWMTELIEVYLIMSLSLATTPQELGRAARKKSPSICPLCSPPHKIHYLWPNSHPPLLVLKKKNLLQSVAGHHPKPESAETPSEMLPFLPTTLNSKKFQCPSRKLVGLAFSVFLWLPQTSYTA